MNKLQTIIKGASIRMGREVTKKEIMSVIMKGSWQMAKAGAAKHGGKASDYIAEAMKMMWDAMYKQALGLIDMDKRNKEQTEKEKEFRIKRFNEQHAPVNNKSNIA